MQKSSSLASRYKACNAETLTTHFATLEKIILENDIDDSRIFNLDEVGATPGKDADAQTRCKKYLTRNAVNDSRIAQFANTSRVTMMPAICADGSAHLPLFVFKGRCLPYREIERNGIKGLDTYQGRLPRNAIVCSRQENGGVNSEIFYSWATQFVKMAGDLTANNRKVLLIYDGYRSHMSLKVLNLFYANDIIAYALPAHTSGKTQPCDVVLFGCFKDELNKVMNSMLSPGDVHVWDMLDFCSMLREAYERSFTPVNIRASFRRAGVWPLDPSKLLSSARPAAADNLREVRSPIQLELLFEQKRAAARNQLLGADARIGASGWLDTTDGAVLTAPQSITLARKKHAEDQVKRAEAAAKALKAAERQAAQRLAALAAQNKIWERRARSFGIDANELRKRVRPLGVRRAIARHRAAEKRRNASQTEALRLIATTQ